MPSRRPSGPCELCPDARATHLALLYEDTKAKVCDRCFKDVKNMRMNARYQNTYSSPYPGGNRTAFFKQVKKEDLERKVTGRLYSLLPGKLGSHPPRFKKRQGDITKTRSNPN
jgi:hypothetical protein